MTFPGGHLRPIDPRALESVIITGRLFQRWYRGPNYEAENRALVSLMQRLAAAPGTVLDLLTLRAMELCRAHSAGISIEEGQGPEAVFRWRSVVGRWKRFEGGTMPRWNSPCAVVVERGETMLMHELGRAFAVPAEMLTEMFEVLLVPLRAGGPHPVGTMWVVSQEPVRTFDREDRRLMESLAAFGGAAWQAGAGWKGGECGRDWSGENERF